MEPNNPAGRFLRIIRLEEYKNGKGTVADAWAKILGIDKQSSGFLIKLASVLELPWQIEKEIRAIPDMDHARYLSWLPPVKRLFSSLQLANPFSVFHQTFDANVQSLIEICDDQLSRFRPESVLSDRDKNDLRTKAEELQRDVEADVELSPSLKDYIRYHIDLIQNALCDYEIQGMSSILGAAEQSVGAAYIRRSDLKKAQDSKHGAKFNTALAALLLAVVAAYPQFKEISQDLIKLLPTTEIIETADSE